MKKSAFISDILFAFIVAFTFAICLFRFLRLPLWLSFTLAFLCGLLVSLATKAFLQKKRNLFFLKKSEEKQKENLLLHLALLSKEQATDFFMRLYAKEKIVRRFSRTLFSSDCEFFCVNCNFQPVTADEIGDFYRLKTSKQRVLICSQIEQTASKLCEKLDIQIKQADDIYRLVKENDAFPKRFLGEKPSGNKREKQLKLCFAKSNSKRFLLSGSLLLFTSLLTPFPYYYLIFGSLLLLTATVIRIFGYE